MIDFNYCISNLHVFYKVDVRQSSSPSSGAPFFIEYSRLKKKAPSCHLIFFQFLLIFYIETKMYFLATLWMKYMYEGPTCTPKTWHEVGGPTYYNKGTHISTTLAMLIFFSNLA